MTTALWLDAADQSTITLNGSAASQWSDKSGNARNAVQATAVNQPQYFQYQNFLLYSEDFTNAAWAKVGVSAEANTTIAPNGSLTADTLTVTGSPFPRTSQNYTLSAGTNYGLSVYVKAGTAAYFNGTVEYLTNPFRYTVNFLTMTAVIRNTTAGYSPSISLVPMGDDWYRVEISFTAPVTNSYLIFFGPGSDANPSISVLGVTTHVWGAQLNSGAPGPYQITTAIPSLTNGLNNQPIVRFDGVNDIMLLPDNTIPGGDSSYSMFVAMSFNSTAPQFVVGTGTTPGSASGNYLAGIVGTPASFGSWWQGYGGVVVGTVALGAVFYGAWYDNVTSVVSVNKNGGASTDTSQAVDRNSVNTNHTIGAFSSVTSPLNASVGEIIITQSALSITDRQKIEGYLAWKWGMQASLPAGHPYKLSPPTI